MHKEYIGVIQKGCSGIIQKEYCIIIWNESSKVI
jgi:hypothetical protein